MMDQVIVNEQAISRFIFPAMLVAFLCIILFFVVISLILNYHWARYGINSKRLAHIRRIYFCVSGILFLVMAGFLIVAL